MAIKNQTRIYWIEFPPVGSKKRSGKLEMSDNGASLKFQAKTNNKINPVNMNINCNMSVRTTDRKPPYQI